MFKAAVHGPNRRRNRVGDVTVASNPDAETAATQTINGISFRVKALETAPSELVQKLGGSHACLAACGGTSGQELLRRHAEQVEEVDSSISVHFHDMAVLVLRVIPLMHDSDDVLYLSEVHRHNHKVCEEMIYPVVCCSRSSTGTDYDTISAIHVEVSPRLQDLVGSFSVAAADIAKKLMSMTYRSILTTHELIMLVLENENDEEIELVCRVAQICVHPNEAHESALSVAEATLDDPYRGRVAVDTEFFISTSAGSSSNLDITGQRPFDQGRLPADVVHVTTSDGEWFPVRRSILAPCLHLTRYVQAGRGKYKGVIPLLSDEDRSEDAPTDDGCPHCKVAVDCHTFDRVLLYLTALLYPRTNKFVPELSENHALAEAADSLGLESLAALCRDQVSTFDSRVRRDRYIPLSEVKARNNQGGELLLILDGMVLDITRWIDEHPGGPSIIPTQALNVDATVFFEMYHVSRQAFVYLKSFYIGELRPEDYADMLAQEPVGASEGFLLSLRAFTKEWRVKVLDDEADHVHKSL